MEDRDASHLLLQAFTSVLTDRVKTAPQVFAAQTIALTGLLSSCVGLDSPDLITTVQLVQEEV